MKRILVYLTTFIGFLPGKVGLAQDKSATRPGLMKQPEAGGTVTKEEGSFAVNAAMGAPSYSLPLPSLPKRAGFGPQIGMSYSSSSGGQDGLGLGWSLSVPSIVVNADLGAAIRGRNGRNDFVHRLSLNGKRLVYQKKADDCNDVYYRLEGSSEDISIVYQPEGMVPAGSDLDTELGAMGIANKRLLAGFKVIYPDGRTQYYSAELDSANSDFLAEGVQESPKNHVVRYPLAVEVSSTGEAVAYTYVSHDSRSYLKQVIFAGGKSKYDFDLVDAGFKGTSWIGGFEQKATKLYGRVRASYDNAIHQQWCFVYGGVQKQTHSQCSGFLSAVDDPNGKVQADQLQAVYRYGNQTAAVTETSLQWSPLYFNYSQWNVGNSLTWKLESFKDFTTNLVDNMELVDYNNDSLVDMVTYGDYSSHSNSTLIFTNNGSFNQSFDNQAYETWTLDYYGSNKAPNFNVSDTHFADINGDGYSDVVIFKEKTASVYIFQAGSQDPWNRRVDYEFTDDQQIARGSFSGGSYQFMDLNGDGRTDIVGTQLYNGSRRFHICRNKSWDLDGEFHVRFSCSFREAPFANANVALDQGDKHRLIDMNGDKLPDYVRMEPIPGQLKICVYFNQGDLFAADADRLLFGEKSLSDSTCEQGRMVNLAGLTGLTDLKPIEELRFVDLNGDSIVDIFSIDSSLASVYTGAGDGSFYPSAESRAIGDGINLAGRTRVVDIDGDGQKEIILFKPVPGDSSPVVIDFNRMNDGGDALAEVSLVKSNMLTTIRYKSGKRYDFKYSTSIDEMLRDGQSQAYGLHFPVTLVKQIAVSEGDSSSTLSNVGISEYLYHNPVYDPVDKRFLGFTRVETIRYGDEYLGAAQTQESSYTEEFFYSDPRLAGRLRERHVRRFPTSGAYASQSQSSASLDPSDASLHTMSTYARSVQEETTPGDYLQTVKQVWATINRSSESSARGLSWYVRQLEEETITWDHGTSSAVNLVGTQRERMVYDQFDAHNLSQRSRTCRNEVSYAGVRIPSEMTETQTSRDGARTELDQLHILTKPDRVSQYDVPYSSDCSGNLTVGISVGDLLSETQYSYDSSNGQVSTQSQTGISRQSSNPEAIAAYTSAHTLSYGQRFEYDAFGNKTKTYAVPAYGSERLVETIGYDADGIFAVSQSNALSHQSTYVYTAGRLSSYTDPNSQVVTIVYDDLGRRTSWSHTSGSEQTYAYTDAIDGKPAFIETSLKRHLTPPPGESANIQQLAAYSPLGEELASMEIAETAGQVRVLSRKDFNRNQKAVREYVPYTSAATFADIRSTGALPTIPGGQPFTAFTWDGIGRIVQVVHPGPSTGANRSAVETKTWHSWGELISKEYFDGVSSRITSCREVVRRGELVYGIADELACGGRGEPHRYNRDRQGNLAAITMAGESQDRVFRYDGFGRMQEQFIPGVGAYYFVYDQWGDLAYRFQLDRDGVFTNGVKQTHDALGRLTQVESMTLNGTKAELASVVESRSYDAYASGTVQVGSLAAPLGQMTAVTTADTNGKSHDYSSRLEYNGRGELVYKEVAVGSESGWFEAYTRTLDGVVYKVSNHQGVEATYGLTASMKLRSVDMLLGGNNESIISNASYNPKGQLQQINYHNGGSQTTLTYNDQTLQLERIQSSAAQTLQDLSLTYNGNNSIVKIVDAVGQTDWGHVDRDGDFSYNERDELTKVIRYGDVREFAYNPVGAFVRNDDYFLDAADRKDLDQAEDLSTGLIPRGTSADPVHFDRAGRLRSNRKVVSTNYDHNNRLVHAETADQHIYYGYNHEGKRTYKELVAKVGSAVTTSLYPLKTVNKEPTGIQTYVFLGDQRLARVEPDNEWFYYLKDHLGSSDIVMTGSRPVAGNQDLPVEQMVYRAYGTEYNPSSLAMAEGDGDAWSNELDLRRDASLLPVEKTHHRFTGQYLDDESGLYYYGARYYDPGLGRFVTADGWFINSPEECAKSPLECNLYGYANNNPIKFTDPTGQCLSLDDSKCAAETQMLINEVKSDMRQLSIYAAGTTAGTGAGLTASVLAAPSLSSAVTLASQKAVAIGVSRASSLSLPAATVKEIVPVVNEALNGFAQGFVDGVGTGSGFDPAASSPAEFIGKNVGKNTGALLVNMYSTSNSSMPDLSSGITSSTQFQQSPGVTTEAQLLPTDSFETEIDFSRIVAE